MNNWSEYIAHDVFLRLLEADNVAGIDVRLRECVTNTHCLIGFEECTVRRQHSHCVHDIFTLQVVTNFKRAASDVHGLAFVEHELDVCPDHRPRRRRRIWGRRTWWRARRVRRRRRRWRREREGFCWRWWTRSRRSRSDDDFRKIRSGQRIAT